MKNIKLIRVINDYTQLKIQMETGIPQSMISKYETGENDIPTSILIQLSRFYEVSIDYLLGETNNPKRN